VVLKSVSCFQQRVIIIIIIIIINVKGNQSFELLLTFLRGIFHLLCSSTAVVEIVRRCSVLLSCSVWSHSAPPEPQLTTAALRRTVTSFRNSGGLWRRTSIHPGSRSPWVADLSSSKLAYRGLYTAAQWSYASIGSTTTPVCRGRNTDIIVHGKDSYS